MARKKVENSQDVDSLIVDENEDGSEQGNLSELDQVSEDIQSYKMDIQEIENAISKLTSQKDDLTKKLDDCLSRKDKLEYGDPVNREQRHVMGVLQAIAKERESSHMRSPLDVALGNRPRPSFHQMKA